MAESNGSAPAGHHRPRRSSSIANYRGTSRHGLYRRDSNVSTTSFMDDVEMAHDEMFSGAVSESVPSSIASFAHRRSRADSTASFTYYQENEDDELLRSTEDEDDSAIIDEEDDIQFQEEDSDIEAARLAMRRTSTIESRNSVHDRLLRSDSARTDGSNLGQGHRTNQKIYIITEDLTIVVAGFRTSTFGFALYLAICILSFGLGYLLLRWLPRWQVRIIGTPSPLRECTWVVIEVSNNRILEIPIFFSSDSVCPLKLQQYAC